MQSPTILSKVTLPTNQVWFVDFTIPPRQQNQKGYGIRHTHTLSRLRSSQYSGTTLQNRCHRLHFQWYPTQNTYIHQILQMYSHFSTWPWRSNDLTNDTCHTNCGTIGSNDYIFISVRGRLGIPYNLQLLQTASYNPPPRKKTTTGTFRQWYLRHIWQWLSLNYLCTRYFQHQ